MSFLSFLDETDDGVLGEISWDPLPRFLPRIIVVVAVVMTLKSSSHFFASQNYS